MTLELLHMYEHTNWLCSQENVIVSFLADLFLKLKTYGVNFANFKANIIQVND